MRFLRLWAPPLLWAILILSASTDQFSVGQSGGWLRRLSGRDVPPWIHYAIRKAAHVFEYGVLAALWLRAVAGTWKGRTRAGFVAAMLLACAVAAVDEFRQSRTRMRRGALDDVLLDVSAAALTLAAIAKRRRRGRRESPALER